MRFLSSPWYPPSRQQPTRQPPQQLRRQTDSPDLEEEAKKQVPTKKAAADSSSHRQQSVDTDADDNSSVAGGYQGEDRKRMLHLHAEQSRRTALKDGFIQLTGLLPNLQAAAVKPTNAVVLAKSADYIRELADEKEDRASEVETIKAQIKQYHEKIKTLQSVLPSQTAGSSEQPDADSLLKRAFERYVAKRTKHSNKFWLLSQLMGKQFESFASTVAGDTPEQLNESVKEWAKDNASVLKLRPVASQLLVQLATSSPMLHEPEKMQEYIMNQIGNSSKK